MYNCIIKQTLLQGAGVITADGYTSIMLMCIKGSCTINGSLPMVQGDKFELNEMPYVRQLSDIHITSEYNDSVVVVVRRYYNEVKA